MGWALLTRRTFTQCKQRTGNGRKEEFIMHPHQEHIARTNQYANTFVYSNYPTLVIRLCQFTLLSHSLMQFLNVYSPRPTKIDCNGFNTTGHLILPKGSCLEPNRVLQADYLLYWVRSWCSCSRPVSSSECLRALVTHCEIKGSF